MISTVEEQTQVRAKFYDAARAMYPDVGEPGTVWVLTQVLGWSWDTIKRISVDGFSRKGYRVFLLNADGSKHYLAGDIGHVRVVTREWTNEEKRKLKDWWWLLGF